MKASTTPHARIKDETDYGYLWWLKSWKSGGKSYGSFYMSGNGGNKVVVITSTNYNTRGMHEQTDRILTDHVLALLATLE